MPRKKRELKDLIERLAPVVRPAILEIATPDSCIVTAAILRRVFQFYGYESQVIPTAVYIYNAQMVKLLGSGAKFPESTDERRKLFALTGAWGIGITPESKVASGGHGFGGHLVLRVGNAMIDASLQQADRPHRGIHIPPFIAVESSGLTEYRPREVWLGDTLVVYRRIDDFSFKKAPDWQRRTSPFPETVSKIIRQVEGVDYEHTSGSVGHSASARS
jgi:hypothetical protein